MLSGNSTTYSPNEQFSSTFQTKSTEPQCSIDQLLPSLSLYQSSTSSPRSSSIIHASFHAEVDGQVKFSTVLLDSEVPENEYSQPFRPGNQDGFDAKVIERDSDAGSFTTASSFSDRGSDFIDEIGWNGSNAARNEELLGKTPANDCDMTIDIPLRTFRCRSIINSIDTDGHGEEKMMAPPFVIERLSRRQIPKKEMASNGFGIIPLQNQWSTDSALGVQSEARANWVCASLADAAIHAAAPFPSQRMSHVNDSFNQTKYPIECDSNIEMPPSEMNFAELDDASMQAQAESESQRSASLYGSSSFYAPSWRASTIAPSIAPSNAPLLFSDFNHNDSENEVDANISNSTRHHVPISGHNHGAAMERLTDLVFSAGQATLGFLTETLPGATMSMAQKGASSISEVLSTHLLTPPVLPTLLPRFFGNPGGEQGDHGNVGVDSNGRDHSGHTQCIYLSDHGRGVQPPSKAKSPSNDEGICSHGSNSGSQFGDIRRSHGTGAHGILSPDPVFLANERRYRQRRSTDLSIASTTVSTNMIGSGPTDSFSTLVSCNPARDMPKPKHRQARRRPLQTIPGPDGLDPEVRRQLEAVGLASLSLRDGIERRDRRNWWDPRRYGLRKYIICHEFRAPRPCTVILLMILVASITLPLTSRSE